MNDGSEGSKRSISASRAGTADLRAGIQPTTVSRLARLQRAQLAVAVYGIISMAVVDVAWDNDGEPWELAVLALGYAVAIWFAHSFANVVAGGRDATWRSALVHEEPVMLGAVPVIVAGVFGQLFGWSSTCRRTGRSDRAWRPAGRHPGHPAAHGTAS